MFLLKPRPKPQLEVLGLTDHSEISIVRGRTVEQKFKLGPNEVSAIIFHNDGSYTDLGISLNLLTNGGRDLVAAAIGNAPPKDGVLTASSATSLTPAGGGMTTDAYKGWRVFSPVTGLTTAPVYGNVGSNSATVLTVDGFWIGTSDTMTGATPASTSGYMIVPTATPRFMGLTENSGAASAADTALTGEITTGGALRALATYAHTPGAATFTLLKSYSITASFPAIHKMGLFTAANATAAGILIFETVLNADANVISGDTLQVTDTVTLS
jgi:hypothetical protein